MRSGGVFMNKLQKFFGFWLCIMMIGGILSFKCDTAFADTHLSEVSGEIPDYPTMVIKFDLKTDIINLSMALHDVLGTLSKHSANVLCPYEMLRPMFISSFERAINTCFRGNDDIMIKKICAIFTDIILKDSLENSLKNKKMSVFDSMQVVFLNYKEASIVAEEQIAKVVGYAFNDGLSEISAVYDTAIRGYRLVVGGCQSLV